MRIFLLIFTTFFAFADDHKAPNFEGLLSSEVFDLDGKLDMYVEKEVHVVLVFQNTFILH